MMPDCSCSRRINSTLQQQRRRSGLLGNHDQEYVSIPISNLVSYIYVLFMYDIHLELYTLICDCGFGTGEGVTDPQHEYGT